MTTETATAYRIVISQHHPARLNQMIGRSWKVVARLKRIDRDLIAIYSRGIPPARGPRSVKLILTLSSRQRGGDTDAYWKSVLDALVTCRLLIDDSRKWCRLEPVEFVRGTERGTVIELKDLA